MVAGKIVSITSLVNITYSLFICHFNFFSFLYEETLTQIFIHLIHHFITIWLKKEKKKLINTTYIPKFLCYPLSTNILKKTKPSFEN